jgi:hypothetical protein
VSFVSLWCLYSASMVSFISSCSFSNSLFLLSWNFLSVYCTFWFTISSIISIKFSLIICRISSFRLFLWSSLGSWHSLSWFCWSLDLTICFLHFPLVPVLIFCWGGYWFPCFFHLPIIALDIVTVPVLCAIKCFLACNNNNGDI